MLRRPFNIQERFFRHIWSKQYLRTELQTADGRSLEVMNVGLLNSDSGPDFNNAKIRLGGVTYTGDVEIHRTMFDWIRHQHQEDPRYNKVILHVVLEAADDTPPTLVHSGRQIPVLVLGNFLSESIHTIWQKIILDERAKKSETIRCFRQNNIITSEILNQWLAKLAVERLELKLRRFEERLKQLAFENRMTIGERQRPYGMLPLEGNQDEIPPPFPELTQKDFASKELWDQILYEGFMEGLGYSKNREPFLRLARGLTLKKINGYLSQNKEMIIESLLFGMAGLIPKIKSLREKESREYVRQLVREWKTMRSSVHSEIIHFADWQFFPTRPLNFPTLRIAAAKVFIEKIIIEDLFHDTVQILKSNYPAKQKQREFFRLFSIETGGFWRHHYNFSKSTSKDITALGNARLCEIIVNAVLPIGLLYARVFKDKIVRDGVLQVYNSLPPKENNNITRLMEKQFIRNKLEIESVGQQQAIIQLYKYYCLEGRCPDCRVGQLLSDEYIGKEPAFVVKKRALNNDRSVLEIKEQIGISR